MNKIQYVGYSLAASVFLATNAFADLDPNQIQIDQDLVGTGNSLEVAIQNGIAWFTGFLYIIAVCYGLYGGFLMMTAGGAEEKVKKGRTILIQVGIGLLVIFLASSIVSWILSLLASTNNG
jgi:hypothetical protein